MLRATSFGNGVGRLKQFRGTVITPVYGRLKLTEIRNDNKQRERERERERETESYEATKKLGRKIGNNRGRGFSHEVVFRQEGKTAVFREIFYRRLRRPCIRGNPGLHVGKSVKFFDLVYQPSCTVGIYICEQTVLLLRTKRNREKGEKNKRTREREREKETTRRGVCVHTRLANAKISFTKQDHRG